MAAPSYTSPPSHVPSLPPPNHAPHLVPPLPSPNPLSPLPALQRAANPPPLIPPPIAPWNERQEAYDAHAARTRSRREVAAAANAERRADESSQYCSRRWALCTTDNPLPDINGPYGYAHVGLLKNPETGEPSCVCRHCHAWLFPNVKHHSGTNIGENSGSVANPQSGICCNIGKVDLPPIPIMPPALHRLWSSQDVKSIEFRAHARGYNSAFMMASTSAKVYQPCSCLVLFEVDVLYS